MEVLLLSVEYKMEYTTYNTQYPKTDTHDIVSTIIIHMYNMISTVPCARENIGVKTPEKKRAISILQSRSRADGQFKLDPLYRKEWPISQTRDVSIH